MQNWEVSVILSQPRLRTHCQIQQLKTINIINQKLGYMVRGGDPDAVDSIVPMAFGNLALDLIMKGIHGRVVVLKNGRYDNVPIDVVTSSKKVVKVSEYYNTERLRPYYSNFEMKPFFLMAAEYEKI
jgi:6-phosphofructokinase 1